MSVVFIVSPMVIAGWPILCGAVAAAAASLGYKALTTDASECTETQTQTQTQSQVEISMEDSQVVAESMARGSEFTICKDDVSATFSRSADGRCVVHVSGDNKTDAELKQIGEELVGRVTQQYAYNKVVTELKSQGFTVTGEEVTNDQAIRIRVSKYV